MRRVSKLCVNVCFSMCFSFLYFLIWRFSFLPSWFNSPNKIWVRTSWFAQFTLLFCVLVPLYGFLLPWNNIQKSDMETRLETHFVGIFHNLVLHSALNFRKQGLRHAIRATSDTWYFTRPYLYITNLVSHNILLVGSYVLTWTKMCRRCKSAWHFYGSFTVALLFFRRMNY